MNNYELTDVLEWLRDNEGLILPHGESAGTHNEMQHHNVNLAGNKKAWGAYRWNPPQYHDHHLNPDQNASPKPTWEKLVETHKKIFLNGPRERAYFYCDVEAEGRIAKLYHPQADRDRNKEYQVRLSGADTSEADEKRLEYIRICHVFEGRIERARTAKQLEKIMNDIRSDKSWPK